MIKIRLDLRFSVLGAAPTLNMSPSTKHLPTSPNFLPKGTFGILLLMTTMKARSTRLFAVPSDLRKRLALFPLGLSPDVKSISFSPTNTSTPTNPTNHCSRSSPSHVQRRRSRHLQTDKNVPLPWQRSDRNVSSALLPFQPILLLRLSRCSLSLQSVTPTSSPSPPK